MNFSLLLFFVALGCFLVDAEARLGESREELIARYGEPVSDDGELIGFEFKMFRVFGYLNEGGKADVLAVLREDGKPLSDTQIQGILQANTEGEEAWNKRLGEGFRTFWATKSGRIARTKDGGLLIYTAGGVKRWEQFEKESVEGF